MGEPQYWGGARIVQQYDVSQGTLRRWANEGKVNAIQQAGKRRLYDIASVRKHMGCKEPQKAPAKDFQGILYARVSSRHQEEAGDLQRQIDALRAQFPTHEVIKDVGSGLNFKRSGLQTLLERIHQGRVKQVVVLHKDRLCRYGIELLEHIFTKASVQLVVLSQEEHKQDPITREQELAQDLIAITNVFVARHNGQRSAENRKRRKRERDQERSSHTSAQDPTVPEQGSTADAQAMARHKSLDVQPMCPSH